MKIRKKHIVEFLFFFLFALLIRLTYVALEVSRIRSLGTEATIPIWEMERAAASVADGQGIRDVFKPGSGPSAHVAPGYAIILGGVYRAVGHARESRRIAQDVLSCFLSSLAIALIPHLARRTQLSDWTGKSAAILLAIVPYTLDSDTNGAWDTALLALVFVLLILDMQTLNRRGWLSPFNLLISGLLLGFATLLSPVLTLIGLTLPFSYAFIDLSATRTILRTCVVRSMIAVVVISPWIVRNYQELGGFVPVRSNLGLELEVGNHDLASGFLGSVDVARHPAVSEMELQEYMKVGELPYMKQKLNLATDWITHHVSQFSILTCQRFRYYWFPSRGYCLAFYFQNRWAAAFTALYAGTISFLAFLSLLRLFTTRHPSRYLFLIALFTPGLIYYVTHVLARYRYLGYLIATILACELLGNFLQKRFLEFDLTPSSRSKYLHLFDMRNTANRRLADSQAQKSL